MREAPQVVTQAAARSRDFERLAADGVHSLAGLERMGCTRSAARARVAARRWQRFGRAVVLHGGDLTRDERWDVALLNCGPRSVLASLTAAESLGLQGWEREEVHVLLPAGVARPRIRGVPLIAHWTRAVDHQSVFEIRRCQRIGPALVLAAAGFQSVRPGCGLLAAGVQQHLADADDLRVALDRSPNLRHRRLLTAAVDDIAMGAHALSEIDFARLCRRHGLPAPVRQAVRAEPSGRRRYLDAQWRRADGRRLVVEVDGALHLVPRRWWDDQLRQNEVTLRRSLVLRFPSVVLRTDEDLVADQLRRGLFDRW